MVGETNGGLRVAVTLPTMAEVKGLRPCHNHCLEYPLETLGPVFNPRLLIVSLVVQWWQVDKVNPIKLFDDNRSVGGFQLRRLLFRQGQHAYVRNVVDKLIDLYCQGKIRPVIDSIWAFEDVSKIG